MDSSELDTLINLFNQLFKDDYNTILVKGGSEPIYLPAADEQPYHRIIFTHDFYASALHEIAHWCVAGEARRLLVDFGYWYKPDGRTAQEQAEFENVEVRPQAFEWLMSVAANKKFYFSADNLESNLVASQQFKQKVLSTVYKLLDNELPPRLNKIVNALLVYSGKNQLYREDFTL